MSKIGRLPVKIPSGVKVEMKEGKLHVKGPKGDLYLRTHPDIDVKIGENEITVSRHTDLRQHRSLHGLTRVLIHNMMIGVTSGYQRILELVGVGYRAEMTGKLLTLSLGYSHPILFRPPDGVSIAIQPKENKIFVTGMDKQLVGMVASKIRSLRPPEPYKGKGVKYLEEIIHRKAGKTAGK